VRFDDYEPEDYIRYALCPYCRQPVQATLERWLNVLADGRLSIEEGIAASGRGALLLYCASNHELGTVEVGSAMSDGYLTSNGVDVRMQLERAARNARVRPRHP